MKDSIQPAIIVYAILLGVFFIGSLSYPSTYTKDEIAYWALIVLQPTFYLSGFGITLSFWTFKLMKQLLKSKRL